MNLSQQDKQQLLKIARQSIEHGLDFGRPLSVNSSDFAEQLQVIAACFVTLDIQGQLRGCIGHLSASQTLVEDVAENAFSAAFKDPRFSPLTAPELGRVEIEISVLTPATKMHFKDENDLLSQIQPGIDGLILQDGYYRGTFLPSVWESLPDKQDFWTHLKLKAGLTPDHWSDTLEVSRYHTLAFSEKA